MKLQKLLFIRFKVWSDWIFTIFFASCYAPRLLLFIPFSSLQFQLANSNDITSPHCVYRFTFIVIFSLMSNSRRKIKNRLVIASERRASIRELAIIFVSRGVFFLHRDHESKARAATSEVFWAGRITSQLNKECSSFSDPLWSLLIAFFSLSAWFHQIFIIFQSHWIKAISVLALLC